MEEHEMTRSEAIYEISTSGDPHAYERAINFAIDALQNDVPRERFEAMLQAIQFSSFAPFFVPFLVTFQLLL